MADQRQRVLTVANLKGGTAKSTVCAFLLHAYAHLGYSVLGVDADPQGSLLEWSELGEWSLPVVAMPVRDLHRRLEAVSTGYKVVVIDTPPLEDRAGIVHSALRAATDVVIPLAPAPIELHRVGPIRDAIAEIDTLRARPLIVSVLLNRVVTGALSGPAARDALVDDGWHVLPAVVARLEMYSQSFGAPIRADGTAFETIAAQLIDRYKKGRHRR